MRLARLGMIYALLDPPMSSDIGKTKDSQQPKGLDVAGSGSLHYKTDSQWSLVVHDHVL